VTTRFDLPVRCREDLIEQIKQGRCRPHRMIELPAFPEAAGPSIPYSI
jgi:hypothetical protein